MKTTLFVYEFRMVVIYFFTLAIEKLEFIKNHKFVQKNPAKIHFANGSQVLEVYIIYTTW